MQYQKKDCVDQDPILRDTFKYCRNLKTILSQQNLLAFDGNQNSVFKVLQIVNTFFNVVKSLDKQKKKHETNHSQNIQL